MNYAEYYAAYFIVSCIICVFYITYKIITGKYDDDIDETGCIILALFFFWPIIIPTATFVWIQNKLKK